MKLLTTIIIIFYTLNQYETKLFIYGLALAGMVGFAACSDDYDSKWADVDGAAPAMSLESTHLQSEQGRTITVKGTLTDNDGIA